MLTVVFSFVFCGTASADPYVGGENLTTVQNGTVSGGLYTDSYYGFTGNATNSSVNEGSIANVTYKFKSLPNNAQIVNATLYVSVYIGNMQEDHPTYININFNGEQVDSQNLSSTYTFGSSDALTINDHTNRITSDYLMWYDVTSLTQQNNIANVDTTGSYDGRIKLITLIIAYDDGDSDTIQYWVNLGHDTDTYYYAEDYIGNTNFESVLPTGSTVENATLKLFHMASADGSYTFNGNILPNNSPQGSYSGSDTWDVTSYFTSYGTNVLTYNRVGSYYKIVLALLTVNYTEPADTRSDLLINALDVTSSPVVNQSYDMKATINNAGLGDASKFMVKLYDNSEEVASQTIDNLSKGASTVLNFNWTPTTSGSHDLKAVIDVLNQVNESNETNNEFNKTLTVQKQRADLVATSLIVPDDPVLNTTYQIKAIIKNSGLLSAGSFVVKLYDGSTLVGSKTVTSLGVGKSTTLSFSWKPTATGTHTLKIVVDTADQVDESDETNNELKNYVIMNEAGVLNVFIISDNPGTNIANMAALDILEDLGDKVSIQIRTGVQVEAMSENELRAYLDSCDIFIGEWITTNAATVLSQVLEDYSEVADKENGVFLILEPPASVSSSTIALMKYSTIKGVKILKNFTNEELLDYYTNTMRGTDYAAVTDYLETVNFPELYNIATLYKDLNDKDSLQNQILWTLNLVGLAVDYETPTFSSTKQEYGIYRYQWYTLEAYMKKYFNDDAVGTVGVIESTMYVDSAMLQTYYGIIEALEAQGLNVIPITAYGGTEAQLDIMVQAFTSAPDYESFIANPSKYEIYVDSIVEMPAYGLGGSAFTEVISFLSALNVPVIRAIHSDSVTTAEWELGTTGLPTENGSEWWHISVLEAQGIIEYTFVGGKSEEIDPDTGASISGYDPAEDNIELLAERVAAWVQLQYMVNSDKLVALIYYNYPVGKDNIGSSYLDTVTSVYNLLKILKENGYTVKSIPEDEDELLDLMIELGLNIASWAPGELEELASNPDVILYSVDDYLEWFNQLDELTQLQVTEGPVAYIGALCKKAVELDYTDTMEDQIDNWYSSMIALLPDEQYDKAVNILDNIIATLKNYITTGKSSYYNKFLTYKKEFIALDIEGLSGWGEAPGDVMVVEKGGVQYFVIPGIKFGNIIILPEPQRGWEADSAKLYHCTSVAPTHQYLAVFAYLQQIGVDGMVYMGRHGTHEWLPGKEVVLSCDDFPSVVTGSVPQIYYYIVDGLAEGEQAKRRGFAVIISHLTPAMSFTSLYGDLGTLATLADDYDGATDEEKEDLIKQIKELITSNNYDLGVDTTNLSDDELVETLTNYLDDLQSTIYPYGLHAIGEQWSDEEIALLVTSMLSVEFEISNDGTTTTLHDEIAQLIYGKAYDDLTTLQKEKIQNKCIEIIEELINSDVTTVASNLTSNPSDGLIKALKLGVEYIDDINQSIKNEVTNLLDALNGGYIEPGDGGDPVANPNVLPTGTNFYDDQSQETPTKEAYEYAETLVLEALEKLTDDTEKIAVGIWCVETARDDGALVSMVLYLLGMKPVWTDSPSAGTDGSKVSEMPVYIELEDLVRPDGWDKKRIDVVIVVSGLFRDLYSRQLQLLDNAFRVALARSYYTILADETLKAKYGSEIKTALDAIMEGIGYYGVGSESLDDNYVAKHWVEDFIYYMNLGMDAEEAGELAITRIFAPPEGDYGAGISQSISQSWTWDDTSELAEYYLNRMGRMYSHNNWGTTSSIVFSRALSGISTVFTSRNTNLYGVLDNDDFFDYWGGLSLAIEYVTGSTPTMYVLDYADRSDAKAVTLEYYMTREMTSRYFNPDWIEGMMNEGYSGARYISKKFVSNLWGWQVTRSSSVKNWMWDEVVDVYLNDKYGLGVTEWLSTGNNAYSMISLTGTLLTAAYNGYWSTDQATLQMVANKWAQMVVQYDVACCDCSCGNIAMMEWALQYINTDLLAQFKAKLYAATQNQAFASGSDSGQQEPSNSETGESGSSSQSGQSDSSQVGQSGSSSQSGSTSSDESSAGAGEEVSAASTQGDSGDQGQAYEISQVNNQQSSSQDTGMPIAATLGVIALVCLIAVGYFRGRKHI